MSDLLPAKITGLEKFMPYFIEARFPKRQICFLFPNGYEVSIINDGRGSENGLYEMAAIVNHELVHGVPPFEDDSVVGWLMPEDVLMHMETIFSWEDHRRVINGEVVKEIE